MDELPEKGAGNLPRQNLPCWNEGMLPSKAELSTGSSTTRGGSSDARRPEGTTERELGMAMTDALADILRTEKDPRQRRSVS